MIDLALVQLPNKVLLDPLMYVNLGVLYVAGAASRHRFSTEVVDMRDSELDPSLIPEAMYVGFSATTGEFEGAVALGQACWECGYKTIIGGAHASLFPNDCKDHFDYVVVGEGENAILDILNRRVGPGTIIESRIKDLDSLAMPAWDKIRADMLFSRTLFPGQKYGTADTAATIIGSRGCPFDCAFCANVHRSPIVYRSPQNIVKEVRILMDRYGIRHFRFEDDNISFNKKWMSELCRELKPLDIKWKCHTRANTLTELDCNLLRWSGCGEVGFGLESADDSVLDLVSKRITRTDAAKAVQLVKDSGMRAKVYLMSGLPGETEETFEINQEFMNEARPSKWTLSRFIPYPGCAVWNNPKKFGVEVLSADFTGYWNFADTFGHTVKGSDVAALNDRHRRFKEWLTTFPSSTQ